MTFLKRKRRRVTAAGRESYEIELQKILKAVKAE